MYPSSNQKKYWTFYDESDLLKLREKANKDYILKYKKNNKETDFLSCDEERQLLDHYEQRLLTFCKSFEPKLPLKVIGTSFHYFKRFYLNNSVMDHIPRDILVTCVYLACKIEEFYIRMGCFIQNVNGDRKKAANIILDKEMVVIQKLNNQLAVWNPYTPVEGILLQLKAHKCLDSAKNVEFLRPSIDEFLEKILLTNAFLLYSPSQIALASVLHVVGQAGENIDSFVVNTFLASPPPEILNIVTEAVRNIRKSVYKLGQPPETNVVIKLEEKLQRCRNPLHDVDSPEYAERIKALDRLEHLNTENF